MRELEASDISNEVHLLQSNSLMVGRNYLSLPVLRLRCLHSKPPFPCIFVGPKTLPTDWRGGQIEITNTRIQTNNVGMNLTDTPQDSFWLALAAIKLAGKYRCRIAMSNNNYVIILLLEFSFCSMHEEPITHLFKLRPFYRLTWSTLGQIYSIKYGARKVGIAG